jgi:hypothetical protein
MTRQLHTGAPPQPSAYAPLIGGSHLRARPQHEVRVSSRIVAAVLGLLMLLCGSWRP